MEVRNIRKMKKSKSTSETKEIKNPKSTSPKNQHKPKNSFFTSEKRHLELNQEANSISRPQPTSRRSVGKND